MRSKNYGINVRVTEQEKQKLLENARFCSLTLSEQPWVPCVEPLPLQPL